jgi:hypothetical protein
MAEPLSTFQELAEARERIQALEAENKRLRDALKSLKNTAMVMGPHQPEWYVHVIVETVDRALKPASVEGGEK